MTARTIRMISCGPFVRPKQAHVIDALPISVKTLGKTRKSAPELRIPYPARLGEIGLTCAVSINRGLRTLSHLDYRSGANPKMGLGSLRMLDNQCRLPWRALLPSPLLRSVQKMLGVQRWQDVRIWGEAVPLWFPACGVGQPTASHHTGDVFCAFPSLFCRPSRSLRPIQSLNTGVSLGLLAEVCSF
jgi:hypothetical protein